MQMGTFPLSEGGRAQRLHLADLRHSPAFQLKLTTVRGLIHIFYNMTSVCLGIIFSLCTFLAPHLFRVSFIDTSFYMSKRLFLY